MGIREVRGILELMGRLVGEIQNGNTINIIALPQWVAIRDAITGALAPYPEARTAVIQALSEVGDGRVSEAWSVPGGGNPARPRPGSCQAPPPPPPPAGQGEISKIK